MQNNTIHAIAQLTTGCQPTEAHNSNSYDIPPTSTMEVNGQVALAQICEQTTNIERTENSRTIKESLAEAIRVQGKKERLLRQSTISIKNNDVNSKELSGAIDDDWVFKLNKTPLTYWNDKEYLHCQFIDKETKMSFLVSGIMNKPPLLNRLVQPNDQGEHFKRRPVRLIINNVRPAINTTRVIEILKNCMDFDSELTDVKDGNPNPFTKTRCIFFRLNGHGLRLLINKLDGEIPYADKASQVKARLKAKINCKPWQCRDCNALGIHQCEGKKCKNCANKGHLTKDCPNNGLKFCGNCKRKGHRSTDAHCPTYLNEIAKELRKMDIPVDMLEDKQSRVNLAKCIQLK